jgi:hypothetical protein
LNTTKNSVTPIYIAADLGTPDIFKRYLVRSIKQKVDSFVVHGTKNIDQTESYHIGFVIETEIWL